MKDQILRRLGEVRYHRATNMWSLVVGGRAVKTLTQHHMRMHVQRLVKEAAARRAAETYPEAVFPHAEARRRAVALLNEIKANQKSREAEMTEPILKRALARPSAPVNARETRGAGLLDFAKGYDPRARAASARQVPDLRRSGRNGGAT